MAVTSAMAQAYGVVMSDGTDIPTKPDTYGEWGFYGLLGRHAHRMAVQHGAEHTTLIVDAVVHAALGLPDEPPPDDAEDYAGLVMAGAARGWTVSAPRAWMTFRRPEATVTVSFEQWDTDTRTGWSYDVSAVAQLRRLEWWRSAFGIPYAGTPGYAGSQTMRHVLGQRRGRGGVPTWQPKHLGPEAGGELPYLTSHWSRPSVPGSWEHGYDLNLAYLAAASVSLVSPHPLVHTGGSFAFDPALSGWWLVEVDRVTDEALAEQLPDPAGYGRTITHKGRKVRWLATPTVKLLDELRAAGLHGGYTIHDSWTAIGTPLLKPWTDVVQTVLRSIGGDAGERDRGIRRSIVKRSVVEGIGMLRRPGGIHRPDWYGVVISQARTNLWRKLHRAFTVHGRGPLRINNDCVWYAADIADPIQAFPAVSERPGLMQLADLPNQLGRFKVESSDFIKIEEMA